MGPAIWLVCKVEEGSYSRLRLSLESPTPDVVISLTGSSCFHPSRGLVHRFLHPALYVNKRPITRHVATDIASLPSHSPSSQTCARHAYLPSSVNCPCCLFCWSLELNSPKGHTGGLLVAFASSCSLGLLEAMSKCTMATVGFPGRRQNFWVRLGGRAHPLGLTGLEI